MAHSSACWQGVTIPAGFARLRDSIHREGMNLSCRTAEFPRTRSGGNYDGRQERRKGLVSGCTTIPRVFHSHGMKTGNGVVGTGQAVVGEKGMPWRVGALTRALLCGDPYWLSAAVRAWLARERTLAVGDSDEKEGNRRNGIGECSPAADHPMLSGRLFRPGSTYTVTSTPQPREGSMSVYGSTSWMVVSRCRATRSGQLLRGSGASVPVLASAPRKAVVRA